MRVHLYGTRGSIPTPATEKHHTEVFGGNTTCIYVETEDGEKHIFDAGSGARQLGIDLAQENPMGFAANLYLTHTHWDHIQGLPFFGPAYDKRNTILVHGSGNEELYLKYCGTGWLSAEDPKNEKYMHRQQRCLLKVEGPGIREVLAMQQQKEHFPVTLDVLTALSYKDLPGKYGRVNRRTRAQYDAMQREDGTMRVYESAAVTIDAAQVNHPGGCLSYRVTEHKKDGSVKRFVFSGDFEPGNWQDASMPTFWKDADLVIADAQYEPADVTDTVNPFRKGFGHSDYKTDVQLARDARVGQLVLTHHNPTMDDDYYLGLEERAKAYAKREAPGLHVVVAREGTWFEL